MMLLTFSLKRALSLLGSEASFIQKRCEPPTPTRTVDHGERAGLLLISHSDLSWPQSCENKETGGRVNE